MEKGLGERLKSLRRNKGKEWTQEKLAQVFNVRQETISKWENGERDPDLETLKKICIFYNTTADYLLGLEDENGMKYYNCFNNWTGNSNITIK